jgi:hypothetical protein
LIGQLDAGQIGLKEAEEQIVSFVHRIGHLMLVETVEKVREPTTENKLKVEGKIALYKDRQNLRFKDRFGEVVVRRRRRYALEGSGEGYYPLDEKLGLDRCAGYSPLMTYLLSFFGACEPFDPASRRLGQAVGFPVSATAVHRNSERTGARLPHSPIQAIAGHRESEACERMLVEYDGILSPQIQPLEGVTGRESLKAPTEWKECNVIAIEKYDAQGACLARWVGAQYGERALFDPYVRQAGLKMGQLKAKEVAVLADGALTNWEIAATNFAGGTEILDFYHAAEHLGEFCRLFPDEPEGKRHFARWRNALLEGQVLQVLAEMRHHRDCSVSDRDKAQGEINYFHTNRDRMRYDEYRKKGYPIGSGLVEGQCKLVVGRRFKGNGMRWKKADNEAVLEVRLAVFNDTLDGHFRPKPRPFTLALAS